MPARSPPSAEPTPAVRTSTSPSCRRPWPVAATTSSSIPAVTTRACPSGVPPRRATPWCAYRRDAHAGVPKTSCRPGRVLTPAAYTVVHVPAGPPRRLAKDELLAYMGTFGRYLAEQWDGVRPDIAHAHFWMSGIAARLAAKRRRVPTVQTFHALGA